MTKTYTEKKVDFCSEFLKRSKIDSLVIGNIPNQDEAFFRARIVSNGNEVTDLEELILVTEQAVLTLKKRLEELKNEQA